MWRVCTFRFVFVDPGLPVFDRRRESRMQEDDRRRGEGALNETSGKGKGFHRGIQECSIFPLMFMAFVWHECWHLRPLLRHDAAVPLSQVVKKCVPGDIFGELAPWPPLALNTGLKIGLEASWRTKRLNLFRLTERAPSKALLYNAKRAASVYATDKCC